jgi:hypothetical protein
MDAILKAEEEFSVWKLEHVCSEYLHIYPELESLLRAFRCTQIRLDRSAIELLIFEFQENAAVESSWVKRNVSAIIQILYQVEFLGAKRLGKAKGLVRELDEFEFYYEAPSPNLNAVDEFQIHPAFWKALELAR